MRRIAMLPLILLGMLAGVTMPAPQAEAETVYVVPRHSHWLRPHVHGYPMRTVDRRTLAALEDEYDTLKEQHERAEARWEAIEDACEGDDDAKMAVSARECQEAKAADEAVEERYEDARNDYYAARDPFVGDPFWHDRWYGPRWHFSTWR